MLLENCASGSPAFCPPRRTGSCRAGHPSGSFGVRMSLPVLPMMVLLCFSASAILTVGCARPALVPQSMSGIYFSSHGDALSVHPGGAVSLVPSASGPLPIPPGPHRSSATASLSPSGSMTLDLPASPPSPLAGASVDISKDGSVATVDWSRTPHPGRGREEFYR